MGICATKQPQCKKPSTEEPRAAKASGHQPPSHSPPAPPARPGRPSPTPPARPGRPSPTPPARPDRPSPAGLGSLKDRYLAAAQQQVRQRSSSEAVGPSISLRNLQAHTPANAKAKTKTVNEHGIKERAPPAAAATTTTKGLKAEAKAAKAAKAAATKAAKEAAKETAKEAKKAAAVAAKAAKQAAKMDKKKTKKSTPEAGPAVPARTKAKEKEKAPPAVPARTKAPPPVPVPSTVRPPPRKAPPPRKTPPLRTKPGGATRAVSPPAATTAAATAATTTATPTQKAPSRFAPQQSPKCDACGKAVYMMERLGAITGGGNYHRACFRCSQCSAQLRPEGGWERMGAAGAAGAAGAELVCCTKCSTQRKRAMTTEPISKRSPAPVPKPWAPSAVQFNIPEQNSVRNIDINPNQRGNAGGGGGGGGGGARGATASIGNSAGVVRPRGKSSILLQWVKDYLSNPIYAAKGVHVMNWHTSWKDGLAFCALLHATNPSLIPAWDSLSAAAAEDNLNLAFRVAEKELGVTKLLDAEDIVEMRRPDAKSITTYVILLHKALSSAPE